MKKCGECKELYPPEILTQMFIASEEATGYTDLICGICALEITNKTHGTNRKNFQGEIAQSMLVRARKIQKGRK